MRKISIRGLLWAVAVCSVGWVNADEFKFKEEFGKSFALKPNGKVLVRNINGPVKITGADVQEVQVRAVKRAKTKEDLQRIQLRFTAEAERLEIETYHERSKGLLGSKGVEGEVEYRIEVPSGANLEEVSCVNGKVTITAVTGRIRANAVNGGVEVEHLAADGQLNSVNGGVTVQLASDLGRAKKIKVDTVNGGIKVRFGESLPGHVKANTLNGGISTDLELKVKKGFIGSEVSQKLGEGGPRIELNSVNGGIEIFSSGKNGSGSE